MKRFSTICGLMILAAAGVLGLAATAHADIIVSNGDTYAAIAYSPETGRIGYAYNYGSRWSAEAAALKNCNVKDARIVVWVNNGFCALALGDDKSCWGVGYSYGDGATNAYARNRALAECRNRTAGARVVLCVCSENVAAEVAR